VFVAPGDNPGNGVNRGMALTRELTGNGVNLGMGNREWVTRGEQNTRNAQPIVVYQPDMVIQNRG